MPGCEDKEKIIKWMDKEKQKLILSLLIFHICYSDKIESFSRITCGNFIISKTIDIQGLSARIQILKLNYRVWVKIKILT